MHRDFNHHLGDLYDANEADQFPTKMDEEMGLAGGKRAEKAAEAASSINLRGTRAAASNK